MLNWTEILIRLSLAALFGAFIGLERERKDWAAGMRTHMMVCVGACLIMIVSAFGFSDILGTKNVTLDPSRVAAQVVSGIGFIGAGAILFVKKGTVRGLTTASGLWTVAAIGLATGGGMYFAAFATTIIALIILWALAPIERLYTKRFRQKTLHIITDISVDNNRMLSDLLSNPDLKVESFTLDRNDDEFIFDLKFEKPEDAKIAEVIKQFKKEEAIKGVFWG